MNGYKCEMYLDGKRCFNKAFRVHKEEYLICVGCHHIMTTTPERLEPPRMFYGVKWQDMQNSGEGLPA